MLNTGLVYSVNAMTAHEKRMDAITYNLANANTLGFKRRLTAAEAKSVGRGGDMVTLKLQVRTDFEQGPIQTTGNRFDLALDGDGWFPVEGPAGEVFTRRGDFRVDEKGVLQTQEGYPVAWKNAPGRIEAAGTAVTVGKSGEVFQDGALIGQLKLVSFPEQQRLLEVDGGYWTAEPDMVRKPASAEVRQFSVEGSNTTSVDELIQMISVQRQYEASSHMLSMIDRSYQRLNRQ